MDRNRPLLNMQTTPEKELPEEDGWSDEEDEDKPSPLTRTKLNNSLKQIKQIEHKNRRSYENSRNLSSTLSDDWSRFQSCLSLKSLGNDISSGPLRSPKKSVTKNFINSNFSPVERISDIYVPSSQRQVEQEPNNAEKSNLKAVNETSKQFFIYFIIALLFALVGIICFK